MTPEPDREFHDAATRPPGVLLALTPVLTLAAGFVGGTLLLHDESIRHGDANTALLVAVLLLAATAAALVARRSGHGWESIQRAAADQFTAVFPMVLILLAIGMLIGTWIFSGTIPYLVLLGIRLVSPEHMIVTAFVVTAIMSLATGTSWGSAGTVGVALVGMAIAIEAPVAATAGAVVSGAYFGDKMSPLSDMTNICALGAGARLYDHIRHMLYTALPSVAVALIVYTVAGSVLRSGGAGEGLPDSARVLIEDLGSIFSLSPLVLLPVLVVIAGIVRGVPPALTMASSSVIAMGLGVVLHGFDVEGALVSAFGGFDLSLVPVSQDARSHEGSASFGDATARLLDRGGLSSMTGTLLLIIAAFLLAGAMKVSGSLDVLIGAMLRRVRSVFGLIAATMASGMLMIGLTSHGGVTALVVGGLYQRAYRDRDLAPQNLSRTLEDSVTIIEPLLPWTVSALFMADTLGVATIDYLPWALFCLTGPIFSLAYGMAQRWTRFGIRRLAAD
ncbi:MAG: Na+/H+ antiporter NhaC [Phycisphaerales bacterium JB037]